MSISKLKSWRYRIIGGVCVLAAAPIILAFARHDAEGQTRGASEYVTTIGPAAGATGKTIPQGDIRKQPVEAVEQPLTLRLTGSLDPDEKSDVGSNAAGIVSQTCVNRGSIVKKGDLLVQLDPRDAEQALDEGKAAIEELRVRLGLDESKDFRLNDIPEVRAAKLAFELAEKNYRRSESLKGSNAISQSDADQMDIEYRSAVQRHLLAVQMTKQLYHTYLRALTHGAILQKALDDCSIRAPFDGWVAARDISVGERVIAMFPGAKLVTLLKIDPLRLSLTVPQKELAHVRAGQTVTFETDAFPGKKFSGTIRYITPAVTSDNRSVCVEALVVNPDYVLRPGLFVTAELQLDQKRKEIYVPQAAVQDRGEVAAVYVVRDGVVREQIVSVGEAAGGRVHILSGLAPSDVVITTPERVHDGDSV